MALGCNPRALSRRKCSIRVPLRAYCRWRECPGTCGTGKKSEKKGRSDRFVEAGRQPASRAGSAVRDATRPTIGDSIVPQVRRAKWMLGIVAAGLFVSGVTIWPATWELKTFVGVVWGDSEPTGSIHGFMRRAIEGLEVLASDYPFLLYGYDWLAFAHIVLAILFLGAMRDPVRNVWVVQFGLIACALVPVLAGICITMRGIPFHWFWVDFAFAPAAATPLWIALRDIRRAESG